MCEIVTESSGSVLRIQLNRPSKKNAMKSAMYTGMADILNGAAKDDGVRAVLWHGAGDSFCAGNDLEDFLKNPMGPGDSPQSRLIDALIDFGKPIVAAVHGFAIGGGTTMLTHCDFVYAGESAKFRMPFINLALVPEFGTSYSIPTRIGYLRAAELIQLGQPFDAKRVADLGLVTQVVPDQELLATATETARKLTEKPPEALQACKRLMRQSTREHLQRAAKSENEEYAVRLRSRVQGSNYGVLRETRTRFYPNKRNRLDLMIGVCDHKGQAELSKKESGSR
jgi:enoyl-CoA hydratase/carnithine racemase